MHWHMSHEGEQKKLRPTLKHALFEKLSNIMLIPRRQGCYKRLQDIDTSLVRVSEQTNNPSFPFKCLFQLKCQISFSILWKRDFLKSLWKGGKYNIGFVCWHLTNVKLGRRSKSWFVLSSRKLILSSWLMSSVIRFPPYHFYNFRRNWLCGRQ